MSRGCLTFYSSLLLVFTVTACAQLPAQTQQPGQFPASAPDEQSQPQAAAPEPTSAPAGQAAAPSAPLTSTSGPLSRLVLGAGDEADMTVYGVPELTQHLRINNSGDVYLPLVGKVTLAGLTADEAQAIIEKKYAEGGFLNNPHVTLSVKDYTTQGMTISGEVNRPGTYSALHARRLFDLFQMAGGLTAKAGNRVTITRAGPEPKTEVLRLSSNPVKSMENNVSLQPGDSVIVSRAGIVYVVGEVSRPGGYVIDNSEGSMTVMQAIAMAAGPTHLANLGHSKLLRRTPTGLENEQLDLKKIIEAKSPDVPLQAEDIVWVPPSRGKIAGEKGANSILSMLTSLAIYRF